MLGAWVQTCNVILFVIAANLPVQCRSCQPSRERFFLYLSLICPPGGSTGPITPSPAFHVLGITEDLRTGEDPGSWLSLTPVAPEMVKSIECFPCKHEDLRSAPKPILEKNILGIVPCACQFSTREVEVGGSLAHTVPPAQTYLGNSRTERDPVSKQNEQTT